MFKNVSQKILADVKKEQIVNSIFKEPKKSRRKIFKEWFNDKIQEFCSVTSLHGYIHTIQKDYHQAERFLWLVLSLIALIVAVVLLWISWNWNAETPTMTVIESTNYATYNLPFPAITICNMNRISRAYAIEIVSQMKYKPENMTDENLIQKFKLLIHFQGSGNASEKEYQEIHDILKANDENVDYVMERLAPKCSDMLERCGWKGSLQRCDSIFQNINTTQGICCSFNNYAFHQPNYDPKLLASIPKEPRRVTSCGYQTGLSILLKPQPEDYLGTEIASAGFRILIHNSFDNADSNAVAKLIPAKTESFLSISPESTYSTKDVFDLEPQIRNCLKENEKSMDVFKQYSFVNCVAECRSALTFELCGCVPYTLPNNGTVKKCKVLPDLNCIRENFQRFAGSLFVFSNDTSKNNGWTREKCKCLPDCLFTSYPSEVSTGALFRDYSQKNSLSFFKDINITDQSLVHIFFNDLISTHYRKDMYQNWLGVLAAFGGLLGLFLGFSLVTGFELIYFFTIRTFFDKLAERVGKRSVAVHNTQITH